MVSSWWVHEHTQVTSLKMGLTFIPATEPASSSCEDSVCNLQGNESSHSAPEES